MLYTSQVLAKLFPVAHGMLEHCWNVEVPACDGSSARALEPLNTWLCRPRWIRLLAVVVGEVIRIGAGD